MVRLIAVIAILLCCNSTAFSQIVRGTIVDEETSAALSGVFVVLLDSVGQMRGGTLTDQKGFYAMRAPYAGTFTLRAERIGHRSITSAPFTLTEAQAHSVDIRVPIAAIALAPIDVEGTKRCEMRGEQGRRTAQLWEEARKALIVTQWARTGRPTRFEWRAYTRELAPHSLEVRTESVRLGSSSAIPYRAVSPDSLARFGFVQNSGADFVYFGPDAEVLLSDIFLEQHCFRSVTGTGANEGMVGLAFEPVRDRELRDITGTLWLDAKTLELRYIDYRYTNMPRTHNLRSLGGRTDFRRLSNGAWIVEQWYIRMPMPTLSASRREVVVNALKEEGGEVLSITDAQASVALSKDGAVRGIVYDSVRGQPLANALVYLSGTSYRGTTDENGNYVIPGVREGNYVIAFTHPMLDSLPAFPLPRSVVVQSRDTAHATLAIGTVDTQILEKCGEAPGVAKASDPAGILFGYVFDANGTALQNVEVRALYKSYERAGSQKSPLTEKRDTWKTKTDASGRYELCKLPLQELLAVTAVRDPFTTVTETRIGPQPFKRFDLILK